MPPGVRSTHAENDSKPHSSPRTCRFRLAAPKELVEATARVVRVARGDTPASEDTLSTNLNRAHAALNRQPGQGLAMDEPVRNIAQGAKTIAGQLSELRNRYGTGHGRATLPTIATELVHVSVDAAMLGLGGLCVDSRRCSLDHQPLF